MNSDPEAPAGGITFDDLRIVAEQCGERLFVFGRDGRFEYVNESACQSLGFTRDELLARRFCDVAVEMNQDQFLAFWDRIPAGGELPASRSHRDKDGSVVPMRGRIARHFIGDRERMVLFARDVPGEGDRPPSCELAKVNARLKQTLDAMAGDGSTDHLLGRVLASVANLLGSGHVALWVFESEPRRFRLRLVYEGSGLWPAGEFAKPDLGRPDPPDAAALRGPDGELIDSPALVEVEVDGHPALGAVQREELSRSGVRSLLGLPMSIGGTILGGMTARLGSGGVPTMDHLRLATTLAQQAILVLQVARLEREAERVAVVEERSRLAREIHDTVAQDIAGILMRLNACRGFLPDRPDLALEHLELAREQARGALGEVRGSVAALRPRALITRDLPGALRNLALDLDRSSAMAWQFEPSGTPRPLPLEVEDGLLRIAQEAAHNAIKHAESTSARIALDFGPDAVRLSISDEGGGFDPGVASGRGFGLIGMNERAARLGGDLAIAGGLARGTIVTVMIPNSPGREDDR